MNGVDRETQEEDLANGDFEIAGFEWNQESQEFTHPYYSMRHQLVNRQLNPERSFFNYPVEATVPAMDGDGDLTVDVQQRLADLASEIDPDEANTIITELAWVITQDLPMLPIQDKYEQSFLHNGRWEYPDPKDEEVQFRWPLFWLPKRGLLWATDEDE